MPPRLEPLRRPPIGFAHRGARAHARENTLEAFELALRLGATGLESDVWLTADGQAVLDHDGQVGSLRRRPIGGVERARLPPHIPTLGELYARCGSAFELSLDVKDLAALPAVLATAREVGAEERLWLCFGRLEDAISVRPQTTARLVDSTSLRRLSISPEQHAARLRAEGIDAVNLHASEWSGGTAALFHRFERYAFGWDAQQVRVLLELLHAGLDGVYGDYVDRIHDAFRLVYG